MNKIADKWQKAKKIILEQIKKYWEFTWFRSYIYALIVLIPLLIVDQVSKAIIYDGSHISNVGETQSDWGFIAFRSQFHTSTTFLDTIGKSMPHWASITLDYVLLIIFTVALFFIKKKWYSIALAVLLAGVIGNTLDASIFHGVRNVMFIPYNDSGTFNFADIFIVVGSIMLAVLIIWGLFKDWKNSKQAKNTKHEKNEEAKDTQQ